MNCTSFMSAIKTEKGNYVLRSAMKPFQNEEVKTNLSVPVGKD